MKSIGSFNIQELAKIYLVANTPNYLFREFRRIISGNPDVHLPPDYRLSRLFNHLMRLKASIKRDVTAYAILIRFTFASYSDGNALFKSVNLESLEWGEAILKLFREYTQLTTTTMTTPPPQIIVTQQKGTSKTEPLYDVTVTDNRLA